MKPAKCPKSFKFNGFTYSFVESVRPGLVIYEQKSDPDFPSNFEVFHVGTYFRIPKDEDFGLTAWTYKTLDEARERGKKV